MILTFKLKHKKDFSTELIKAKKVAEYAVNNGGCSSKCVRYIGLKSAIACQILRKYGRNTVIRRVRRVNLIVPGQRVPEFLRRKK